MRIAWRAAVLVVASGLVAASVVDGAGSVQRHPDFVWAPVAMLHGQMLRVCVRHVGRPSPSPAAQPMAGGGAGDATRGTWRALATDATGEPLVLSDPVPLPGVGQFACVDVGRDDIPRAGENGTGLLEVGMGVLVRVDVSSARRRPLLTSMQLFDLTAGSPQPVPGGHWIGKGADKFNLD